MIMYKVKAVLVFFAASLTGWAELGHHEVKL